MKILEGLKVVGKWLKVVWRIEVSLEVWRVGLQVEDALGFSRFWINAIDVTIVLKIIDNNNFKDFLFIRSHHTKLENQALIETSN